MKLGDLILNIIGYNGGIFGGFSVFKQSAAASINVLKLDLYSQVLLTLRRLTSAVLKSLVTIPTLLIVVSTMFVFLEDLSWSRALEDSSTVKIFRHATGPGDKIFLDAFK